MMNMAKAYKIGTVETFKVNSSGRRLYVNLDADTVIAFGIQKGDRLKVRIYEGFRPDNQGTQGFPKSFASPKNQEEGKSEE